MSQSIVNGTLLTTVHYMVLWATWQSSFENQDDTGSRVPRKSRKSQNRRDPVPAQSVTENLAKDQFIIDP